ncbi:MAG: helix-turn-helix domain-containing protein [Anaeroplasmataceae bacterium]|nr:helix-turn-helix domain-containing protein [Anaeroplasmataceae bacterium]
MEKYIILKTEQENFSYIIDVFRLLIGNTAQVEENRNFIKIKCQDIGEIEIEATIESLESDLNALISSYQTTSLKPSKEIALVEKAFLEMSYGHYQFKSFLYQVKEKGAALDFFQFIVEGSGVTEDIILAMADCDLNVSKASNLLYMHRNTLLYKIDRLISLSDFDLKSFNDLYLLVQLLRAK